MNRHERRKALALMKKNYKKFQKEFEHEQRRKRKGRTMEKQQTLQQQREVPSDEQRSKEKV
jgi:hypothetical protein